MNAYTIRKELLGEVMGLADDCAGSDESAISTLNVRLDNMLRECLRQYHNVVHLHGEDLAKLVGFSKEWKAGGRTLSTTPVEFKVKDGISHALVREINSAPDALISQVALAGKLVFCHSPQFHFVRTGDVFKVCVWLHAIYAPGQEGESCGKDQCEHDREGSGSDAGSGGTQPLEEGRQGGGKRRGRPPGRKTSKRSG